MKSNRNTDTPFMAFPTWARFPRGFVTLVMRRCQPHLSWMQFHVMAITSLAMPSLVLYRALTSNPNTNELVTIGCTWCAITCLILLRLASLVQTRERFIRNDLLFRHSAAAFKYSSTFDHVHAAAMRSADRIVETVGSIERMSLLVRDEEDNWKVIDSEGIESAHARGRIVDKAVLVHYLGEDLLHTLERERTLQPDVETAQLRCITSVPFGRKDRCDGLLLVTSLRKLKVEMREAIEALALDISAAYESVALTEHVRRRESEVRFQALVRNTTDVTAVIDARAIVRYITPSVSSLLGRSPDAMVGKSIDKLFQSDDLPMVYQLVALLINSNKTQTYAEVQATASNGEIKHLELTLSDYRNEPSVNGLVLNAHDITERKKLEEDLRHQVLHDGLTGIANRLLFAERVQHAMQSRRLDRSLTAVVVLDIDDFKTVNDGLGHGAGDELLRVIAFRLTSFVRAGDTAARLGSDVFALLLEEMPNVEAVEATITRLREVIGEPLSFESRDVHVTAGIGVSVTREYSLSADDLLRNADVAMHHAKQAGKNCVRVYDESMHQVACERLELKAELGNAIERNEFLLVFQPIVEMQSGNLRGFEALLRWNHPERGLVNPLSFIPLAEETGLIHPIGKWVAKHAIAQLAHWQHLECTRQGIMGLNMNINVSVRQLEEQTFVEIIKRFADENEVNPCHITFELTKTSNVNAEHRGALYELRDAGFGIAANDFGTGFANHSQLHQLPLTQLKIDRGLIAELDDDAFAVGDARNTTALQVRSIVEVAHALGLTTVAEGVEKVTQRDVAREVGVDFAQGWFYAKPAVADEATWFVTGARTSHGVAAIASGHEPRNCKSSL